MRKLMIATLVASVAAIGASVAPAAAGDFGRFDCRTVAVVSSEGHHNSTSAFARHCAEVGIDQRGDYNRTSVEAVGPSRVAVGTYGGSRTDIVAHGGDHDMGAVTSHGGYTSAQSYGWDVNQAHRNRGGRTEAVGSGRHNNIRTNNVGSDVTAEVHGIGNNLSIDAR